MQVDCAVELGADDETLEFPWVAPGEGPRYHDLKRQPETLALIQEATGLAALREFLVVVNSPTSLLESAKCDVWGNTDINPEEEIFGALWKFGSYVDLVFTDPSTRFSFDAHQNLLQTLTTLLKRVPEIPASAEFLLRRCFYHEGKTLREGFYVTFYLFGYGSDELRARQQWAIALKLTSHAIARSPSCLSRP
jgi:hypothetical protein